MVGRCVQRIEAMILFFDFRAIRDRETYFPKAPDNIIGHLRQWMEPSQTTSPSRQSKIRWFTR
jgi:hypothetical protein